MTDAKKDNLTKRVARAFLDTAKTVIEGVPPTTVRFGAFCDPDNSDGFFTPDTVTQMVIGIGVFDAPTPHTHIHMFWETNHPVWGKTRFYGVRDDESQSGGILDRLDIYFQSADHAGHIGFDYTTGTEPKITNQIRKTIDYRGDDYLWHAIKNRCLMDITNGHHILLSKEGDIRHPISMLSYDKDLTAHNLGQNAFCIIPAVHDALDQSKTHILASAAIKIDHAPALRNPLHSMGTIDQDCTARYMMESVRHGASRCMVALLGHNQEYPPVPPWGPNGFDIIHKTHDLNRIDMLYILARDGRFSEDIAHPAWRAGQEDQHLGRVQDISDIPFLWRKESLVSLEQWRYFRQDNRQPTRRYG